MRALLLCVAACGRIGFDPHPLPSGDGGVACRAAEPALPACTVYVAVGGDDAAIGSRDAPFATVAHAFGGAGPGTVVCLLAGDYHEQIGSAVVIPSGVPGNPLVLMAEPGAHVVLHGVTALIVIQLKGLGALAEHDIEIRNFELSGAGIGLEDDTHDIRVVDLAIHDTPDQGVSTEPLTNHCTFVRVTTDHTVLHGIAIRGSDHQVIDCSVQNNTGGDYALQVFDSTDRVLVRGCTIAHNDGDGMVISTGADSVAVNNVLFDNAGPMRFDFLVARPRVEHNTAILASGAGLVVGDEATSATVVDNLAVIGDVGAATAASSNLVPDPAMFVSATDFHLVPGAAPVNAGEPTDVCDDHDGVMRDALPDIGAYELN